MTIQLNGRPHETPGSEMPLPAFLETLPLGSQPVLVEINGRAVLAREIPDSVVRDGDRVEVVRMVAGG